MPASLLRAASVDGGVLTMVLGNGLGAIAAGRVALDACCDAWGLSPAVVNRIEVIFEEVVANIVRHGFAPGSGQEIHVAAQLADGFAVLHFEDDGVAFDPLAVAPPAPFTSLAEAAVGGLGVPMVRRLASDVVYAAGGCVDGGFRPVNRLTVRVATVAISPAPPS